MGAAAFEINCENLFYLEFSLSVSEFHNAEGIFL